LSKKPSGQLSESDTIKYELLDKSLVILQAIINKEHSSIKYKLNNLDNLLYIRNKRKHNLAVILGNRDLMKLKAFIMFKLQETQEFKDDVSSDEIYNYKTIIQEYNTPTGIILPMTYDKFKKFKKSIKDEKFSFNISSCITNFLTYMKQLQELYVGSGKFLDTKHTFTDMFQFIFDIVGGGNLLYALIGEILLTYEILKNIIYSSNLDLVAVNITNENGLSTNLNENVKEYFCYIIGFLFNKMFLSKSSNNSTDEEFNSINLLYKSIKSKEYVNDYKSLDGLLYDFFTHVTTYFVHNVNIDKKVHLLSHGGITKYCAKLYTTIPDEQTEPYYTQIYDRICADIKGDTSFTIKDICDNIKRNVDENPNFTADNINKFVKKCNNFFKQCIIDILTNNNILCAANNSFFNSNMLVNISSILHTDDKMIPFASLIYVLLMGTEIQSNDKLKELFVLQNGSNSYLSPIGPGILDLSSKWSNPITDVNMKFNDNDRQLIQIMGHKPFGICPSFYTLPDDYHTTLVCTDTSNSFVGTKYNTGTEYNYSYVSITNAGQLASYGQFKDFKEFVFQKLNKLSLDDILHKQSKHTIYCNKTMTELEKISIKYQLTIVPQELFILFNKLITNYKNMNYFYNGIMEIDSSKYHVFTIVRSYNSTLIIGTVEEIKEILTQLTQLTTQEGGFSSLFKKKYLKYKQKYLELTNKIK
jgi:hypothetical protein